MNTQTDYRKFQAKDEIRLLHLQRGSFSDPVECTLVHVRLSNDPEYEALSYMWGSPTPPRTIRVDQKERNVGENLWQALFHLRLAEKTRILWVDALCINQANDRERNHQVMQMGSIYSKAHGVCVWLGEASTSSTAAIDFLNANFNPPPKSWDGTYESTTAEDIKALVQRRYWTRLWIIQEVILGADILLYCGAASVSWDTLWYGFDQSEMPTWPNRDGHWSLSKYSSVWNLHRHRRRFRESSTGKQTFLELTSMHAEAQCMDVRDRLFGMHSLASSCCSRAIKIDYGCSAYELCQRLLEHEILVHSPISDGLDTKLFRPDSDMVRKSRRLHKILRAFRTSKHHALDAQSNPNTLDLATIEWVPNPPGIRFTVEGHVNGGIGYITPCLHDFSPRSRWEFPRAMFTSALDIQAMRDAYLPMIYQAIPLSFANVRIGTNLGEFTPPNPDLVPLKTDSSLHSFISDASQFSKSSGVPNEFVAFFVDPDMIGFCPMGVMTGDLLCEVGGIESSFIVRKTKKGYEVIGRAIVVSMTTIKHQGVLELDLDVESLQRLTCMPQYEHVYDGDGSDDEFQ